MQTKTILISLVILGVIVLGIGFLVQNNSNTVPQTSDQPIPTDIAETIQVHVGEKFVGQTGTEITVTQITEDSRCPANVNCIWAGRVVVRADVGFDGAQAASQSIATDKPLELPEGKITLTEVQPAKTPSGTIKPEEYIFTFSIQR